MKRFVKQERGLISRVGVALGGARPFRFKMMRSRFKRKEWVDGFCGEFV